MRKNFNANPYFFPLPVLIVATYDKDGHADAMNAAWGGLYEADEVILCLSAGHKTTKNILESGAFTVSFGTLAQMKPCDYVGLVSANTAPDKLEKAGFTVQQSSAVNAPVIQELPVALECRFVKQTEDGNIVGKIVNISADESVLDENGNISADLMQVLSFDPVERSYRVLGKTVGQAFAVGNELK